jgi:hypothetical protein
MEELKLFINNLSHLKESDVLGYFAGLKLKFNDFLKKLEEEDDQAKLAFHLLVQSTFEGKELTHEEKIEIENQLKEVLKTIGLVGMTVLPGGTLFFLLAHFLKLNKYIIPSVFLNNGK